MDTTKITIYLLSEDEDLIPTIQQTLKGSVYEPTFIIDDKNTAQDLAKSYDLMIFRPSMHQWRWLDRIITFSKPEKNQSIILFSPESSIKDGLSTIIENQCLYVTNRLDNFITKLPTIFRAHENIHKTVLFVDDDLYILQSYRRALHKTPWKIMTVLSGEEALDILESKQIDLLVTDIKMPSLHGIDLVSKIRERFEHLPIFVCSGFLGMRDDPDLKMHEIAEFLEKPVDPTQLITKINKTFGYKE